MFGEGKWESVSGDEGDVRNGMDLEGEREDGNMDDEEGGVAEVEAEVQDEVKEQVENTAAQRNYNVLDDMFKPQVDTGGFSLGLDHELDLMLILPTCFYPTRDPA